MRDRLMRPRHGPLLGAYSTVGPNFTGREAEHATLRESPSGMPNFGMGPIPGNWVACLGSHIAMTARIANGDWAQFLPRTA